MKEFFNSLDGLHEQMLLLYPGMRPPSFRAKESKYGRRLEVHYNSERPGLEYLVVGLIKAVADKLFGIIVNYQAEQARFDSGQSMLGGGPEIQLCKLDNTNRFLKQSYQGIIWTYLN